MGEDKSTEEFLDRLAQKAGDHMQAYGSCAQGTLRALQEEFGLGNAEVLKAATAMPGVALRGETCGAVLGAIMALGLAFGREKPDEYEAFMLTQRAAHRLCRHFAEEFGSCMCSDIHMRLFGRRFDLTDPRDMEAFAAAGASERCRKPVGWAARAAGRMILEARQ